MYYLMHTIVAVFEYIPFINSYNFYQITKTDNLIFSDQNIWKCVFGRKRKIGITYKNHFLVKNYQIVK